MRLLKRACANICVRATFTTHPSYRMSANCCKKTLHYLGFSGESVHRFTLPQAKWPCAPILWCIYRAFLAVYLTVWLILILIVWGEPPFYDVADSKAKWLIFVSNWSFLILILYLMTMAVGNIYYHIRHGCRNTRVAVDVDPESDPDPEGMIPMSSSKSSGNASAPVPGAPQEAAPWYFKFAWFLQTIAFTAGLFVALLFYVLVFNPAEDVISAYNFHVHGVNLIIIMLDMILGATPMRLLHIVYPTLFALIYFLFTLIYYAAGGLNHLGSTYIYRNFLDWGTVPGTTGIVMTITVLVGAPILYLVLYAVYRIRLAVSKCCDGCCWTY